MLWTPRRRLQTEIGGAVQASRKLRPEAAFSCELTIPRAGGVHAVSEIRFVRQSPSRGNSRKPWFTFFTSK